MNEDDEQDDDGVITDDADDVLGPDEDDGCEAIDAVIGVDVAALVGTGTSAGVEAFSIAFCNLLDISNAYLGTLFLLYGHIPVLVKPLTIITHLLQWQ